MSVGSRNLVHERTFQSVVTEKAVSEHQVEHLSNMHPSHRSLWVGDMDLAIHRHQKSTSIPHAMLASYPWRCVA